MKTNNNNNNGNEDNSGRGISVLTSNIPCYDIALTSDSCPDATKAWQAAKDLYSKNFGGSWF